jgi:hypothetical protein
MKKKMRNNALNQGLDNAARSHYAGQPSIFATDAEMDEWIRMQELKKKAVTPYQPGTVVEYVPPLSYDVPSELQPYTSDAEALKDLGIGLAKLGFVAIGGTAIVGGAVWVWNALTVTAAVVAAPVSVATGVSWSAIGWGIFALIALFSLRRGVGGSEPQRSAPGAINQATSQNITVVVNVAGHSVTTNGKG